MKSQRISLLTTPFIHAALSFHTEDSLSHTAMRKNTIPRANSTGKRRGLCSSCRNKDFSFTSNLSERSSCHIGSQPIVMVYLLINEAPGRRWFISGLSLNSPLKSLGSPMPYQGSMQTKGACLSYGLQKAQTGDL